MNLSKSVPSGAVTANGNSGWLNAVNVANVTVGVNVTAASGTTPTLDLYLDVLGADGIAYPIWHGTQLTAAGVTAAVVAIGAAGAVRLRWVMGGTTPSFTFSASLEG